MDHIIYTTLNAFKESWPDVDTSVWDILTGRIRELLLCPECHEPIFTNLQQKNITILTDRCMIHSVCLECPATKAKERNDDIKSSNYNSDMIKALIIKEQEALEAISYPENNITNLQDVCSIEDISFEKALLGDREMDAFLDGEYKKKVNLDLPDTSDILLSESSTNSHPISNNPVLSEQNAKIKAPKIDI
ncbi:hypothetical protein C1645_752029 [Glomus cerebriforme]|uniref:Uncharacterized protein n=1 Tax=Glomus cerebriforme TaxID=658196 RepID=A0A397TRF8_9GLOM|nr:hypothetical protein C1645_752029 [Glomus cerebriforme]